jgi:putative membrane protein
VRSRPQYVLESLGVAGWAEVLSPFAGLLPEHLAGASLRQLRAAGQEPSHMADDHLTSTRGLNMPLPPSPSVKSLLINDEEASLGLSTSTSPALRHSPSVSSVTRLSQSPLSQSPLPQSPASELPHLSFARSAIDRIKNPSGALKRRPTAVRIVMPPGYADHAQGHAHTLPPHLVGVSDKGKKRMDERTPLIKPGVKPDVRRTPEDVRSAAETIKRAEIGLGRMVELGLPLIM